MPAVMPVCKVIFMMPHSTPTGINVKHDTKNLRAKPLADLQGTISSAGLRNFPGCNFFKKSFLVCKIPLSI